MSGLATVFTICAIVGGILFLIKLVLQFMGADGDTDVDVDLGGGHMDISHTDSSFKLLSAHGVTAFLMMFGLGGRALLLDSQVNAFWALAGAVAIGLFSMWVVARIFSFMTKLQSSGTVDISRAIGEEGTVYLNIPEAGTGKVQVSIRDRLRVEDAVSKDKKPINTGETIKVVGIVAGNVLVVERAG